MKQLLLTLIGKVPLDKNLKRLLGYLPPYKGKLITAVIFMAAAGGTASIIATGVGALTDLGFYQKQAWVVLAAPVGLIFIAAMNGFFIFMSSYLLAKVSQSVLVDIRTEIFNALLHWPAMAYQNNPTGVVSSKFVNEANTALSSAAQSCILVIRNIMQVLSLLCVLVYFNWQLTIVTLMISPLIVFVLKQISRRMRDVVTKSQQSIATMLCRVQETYEAQRIVKIFNTYEYETRRFEQVNMTIRKICLNMMKFSSLGTPLTQLITMIGVAVVVSVALWEAQQGMLTTGEFITFLSAMLMIMPPLRQLSSLNATFVGMSMAALSIFSTIDEPREEDKGTVSAERVRGSLEFDHVSLKYPGQKIPAVNDFCLSIAPGEHVALVGVSGSGKSSVVNMVPRFWKPTSGKILLDGINYEDYTLTSLRNQISIVSQDVVIFDDTIRENIRYGSPEATDEAIWKAVEASALKTFIESLPQGLDTRAGEAGSRLSGGQKQRISIARALLKDAPILILDEATSALDSESESVIKEALRNLTKGRTTITVAHRLSTIEDADKIVVMAHGDIKEMGTHKELIAKDGIYANLCRLQGKGMLIAG